jgi:putative hemolysin
MVPRTDVVFLDASLTVSKAIKLAAETPHERYPVVGRTYDEVLGFVHIRDLILGDSRRDRTVGSMAREIKVMPGTKRVLAALSEMRREGHHLAIVVDEYGGTDGIVALEDLVEEVIGDISDEGGRPAADDPRRFSGGVVELDGKENLDEVAEVAGLELPEGPYATLGGYVMAELGRLPQVHDRVTHDGFLLDVIEVDGRRAARVRVTPPAPEPERSGAEPDATIGDHG